MFLELHNSVLVAHHCFWWPLFLTGKIMNLFVVFTVMSCFWQNDSLPFNKYAFLTTHNSFANEAEPLHTGIRITFTNQEDTVTQQLNVSTLSFVRSNPVPVFRNSPLADWFLLQTVTFFRMEFEHWCWIHMILKETYGCAILLKGSAMIILRL